MGGPKKEDKADFRSNLKVVKKENVLEELEKLVFHNITKKRYMLSFVYSRQRKRNPIGKRRMPVHRHRRWPLQSRIRRLLRLPLPKLQKQKSRQQRQPKKSQKRASRKTKARKMRSR
jgi:hypothetical protein